MHPLAEPFFSSICALARQAELAALFNEHVRPRLQEKPAVLVSRGKPVKNEPSSQAEAIQTSEAILAAEKKQAANERMVINVPDSPPPKPSSTPATKGHQASNPFQVRARIALSLSLSLSLSVCQRATLTGNWILARGLDWHTVRRQEQDRVRHGACVSCV